jgi:hypothetical protein
MDKGKEQLMCWLPSAALEETGKHRIWIGLCSQSALFNSNLQNNKGERAAPVSHLSLPDVGLILRKRERVCDPQ